MEAAPLREAGRLPMTLWFQLPGLQAQRRSRGHSESSAESLSRRAAHRRLCGNQNKTLSWASYSFFLATICKHSKTLGAHPAPAIKKRRGQVASTSLCRRRNTRQSSKALVHPVRPHVLLIYCHSESHSSRHHKQCCVIIGFQEGLHDQDRASTA